MIREERGDERIEDPNMDMHFINGLPISAGGQQQQQVIDSVKSLHSELVKVVQKDG